MTSRNVVEFYRWSEAIIFALGEAREPEKALIKGKRVVPKERAMPETANRIESLFAAAVALAPEEHTVRGLFY